VIDQPSTPADAVRIVLLSHEHDAPSASLVVVDGRIVERGELIVDPAAPPEPLTCVLIVPGTQVLARWLELPVRTEAQAGPAAALLLEEQLATPASQTQVALGAPEIDSPRLAVVVDRSVLDDWIERATALGVFPDVVIPDHLTLPSSTLEDAVAVRFGETYAVRGEQLALSCEADLLPLILSDRPWREITEATEIEAILVAAAAAPVVNLLQPASVAAEPASTWRQLRAAAVMLGLLLLSPLALSAANIIRHDAATREVERRTEERVRDALPPAERIVNPDAQLQTRIEALRTTDPFPASAAALFGALQQVNGMDVEGMTYERGRPLRATVSFASSGDLDLFRTALRQVGHDAAVSGVTTLNGRNLSEVTLSRSG
jgi:general secretion pathway protein L